MEQEFVKSFEIDKLGKNISDGIYKVKIDNKESHFPEVPSNKKATDVVLSLCFKWNKDLKSRNFVMALIKAFYNINWKNKIDEFVDSKTKFCCISRTPLIGKKEFIDILNKFKRLKKMTEMQQNDQLRAQKIDSVAEWVDNMKANKNFSNPHFGYYSEKTNFPYYICVDTYYGIKAFCKWAQQYGVKEIINIVNKKYNIEKSKPKIILSGTPDLQKLRALREQKLRQARENFNNQKKKLLGDN